MYVVLHGDYKTHALYFRERESAQAALVQIEDQRERPSVTVVNEFGGQLTFAPSRFARVELADSAPPGTSAQRYSEHGGISW